MILSLEIEPDQNATPGTEFVAFNPQLPLIAAKAAIEIEQLRLGHSHGLDQIKKLVDMMFGNKGTQASLFGGDKSFIDPLGAAVLAKAYVNSHRQAAPLRSQKDLNEASTRLATEFSTLDAKKPATGDDTLLALRDFCSALSEYSAMSRRLVAGDRPKQPQRK